MMLGRFHYPSLSRMAQESKGFLGICSIPCSRRNTTSLSGDIAAEPDVAHLTPRCRAEQRGDRVGLIVPHLEHHPAVWNHLRIRAAKRRKKRKPSSPPSSAGSGSKQRTSGSSSRNLSRRYVGRIGNQDIERAADGFERIAHSHCARSRDPESSRRWRARPRSAAALMSVPTPGACGSSHEQRQQQAARAGADIQDAQRRAQPALLGGASSSAASISVSLSGRGSSVAGEMAKLRP